ncbi:MAG: deoxyribonuclease IV [Deltaproteobacteria bacterium]|nr:deoxyribonuclease IV [Deltaproteobacteria bacterium]
MPKIGAHMSIAGGVSRALDRGEELGLDTIQIFTKNANQWTGRPISDEEQDRFKRRKEETGIDPVIAHDSYLINLASPDREMFQRSLDAFEDELLRCHCLEVPWLVMHPGAHLKTGEARAIVQIGKAIKVALLEQNETEVGVLLETTAGQGTQIGYRFEHLRDIMREIDLPERVGVCLDTCHIFAAGYDIRSREAYERTMDEFDKIVGLEFLQVIHVNDSKRELGSHVDRHEHIGRGQIGEEAFSFFLNDARLWDLPFILETPKTAPDTQVPMDTVNVELLRKMLR